MQELLDGLCIVGSMYQGRNHLKCVSGYITMVISRPHFSGFVVYGGDHIEDAYVFLGNYLYG